MDNTINIADILTTVVVVVGSVLTIVGAVVKLTKTKKDDEVFEDVANVVKPVVDALDPKKPKV